MRCSGELKRCVLVVRAIFRWCEKKRQPEQLVEKLGTPLRYMKYKYPSKFEISYFKKKLKQIIE